nr:MAG TPA: hypothetical protein [Inoviridae sp.]
MGLFFIISAISSSSFFESFKANFCSSSRKRFLFLIAFIIRIARGIGVHQKSIFIKKKFKVNTQ